MKDNLSPKLPHWVTKKRHPFRDKKLRNHWRIMYKEIFNMFRLTIVTHRCNGFHFLALKNQMNSRWFVRLNKIEPDCAQAIMSEICRGRWKQKKLSSYHPKSQQIACWCGYAIFIKLVKRLVEKLVKLLCRRHVTVLESLKLQFRVSCESQVVRWIQRITGVSW